VSRHRSASRKELPELGDWRGETLSRMRKLIKQADPRVVEEWKWMGTRFGRTFLDTTGGANRDRYQARRRPETLIRHNERRLSDPTTYVAWSRGFRNEGRRPRTLAEVLAGVVMGSTTVVPTFTGTVRSSLRPPFAGRFQAICTVPRSVRTAPLA